MCRDYVGGGVFHSMLKGVPCLTLGWDKDGVPLYQDKVVAKRAFKCGGKNGCGPACKVKLV